MRRLKVKRLTETAKIPTKGSKYAAGLDLYADLKNIIEIPPHETVLINTGIAVEIPTCMFGGVYARSGLATKYSIAPINCVGIIDEDYRGEIKVALHNHSNKYRTIEPGDRIAQLIVQPYTSMVAKEVKELSNTERGANGFGSSGRK